MNESVGTGTEVVSLEHVWFSYDHRPALEDVSLSVEAGSFTALIGPNGAGKSTVLRLLLGLQRPASGTVTVFGRPPGEAEAPIGYVPQRMTVPGGFPLSVREAVLMGRFARLGPFRRPGARDREVVDRALGRVGLADLGRERFADLSGGQQQRALIARALATEPRLLLLDEPTAGLDPASRARFYALVCDLQHGEGLTLLCASHDLEVVSEHADRLILLDRSVRAEGAPGDVRASPALEAAYRFPSDHEHG